MAILSRATGSNSLNYKGQHDFHPQHTLSIIGGRIDATAIFFAWLQCQVTYPPVIFPCQSGVEISMQSRASGGSIVSRR